MATENALTVIKAWEGVKDGNPHTVNFDPYLDPIGVVTIGYGHVVYDPRTLKQNRRTGEIDHSALKPYRGVRGLREAAKLYPTGITLEQADSLLSVDLDEVATRIRPLLRKDASTGEIDALTSFAFNLGAGKLARSSLIRMHTKKLKPPPVPDGKEALNAASQVRAGKMKVPQNLLEGFLAYSFASGGFFLGLFCRRLSEYALYTGMDGISAVKIGIDRRKYITQQRRSA